MMPPCAIKQPKGNITSITTLVVVILCIISSGLRAQAPFSRGVNLTNWFQVSSAHQIQFTKFTKKDFENMKSLGCDVIRLPINLHFMTNGAPDYTLDPLFLDFLDQAVTWAEDLQLHLILDNHTFDPSANTDPAVGTILVKVWTQMATHYKDRSDYIHYEILNEPHGISAASWNAIQNTVIDAIRAVDTKHYVIVGGTNFNSYAELAGLPVYTQPKLIYTFHFYDPFLFTHQGADWTTPSLTALTGIPFPYKSPMPVFPTALKGTWIEDAFGRYGSEGTAAKVKQLIDVAVNFKTQRNATLFCGEFGVYIPNSNNDDRVAWYKLVRMYLEEKGIAWTTWDYTGGYGLFLSNSNEMFDYDLNRPLLRALNFNVPVQKIYKKKPVHASMTLYDEYIGSGVFDATYPDGGGTYDLYASLNPQEGSHSIFWTGVTQYNAITLDFKPNVDLSLLPARDFELSFWVRGNSPTAKFDIRFVDTKTSTSDHPWRMGKTIDNTLAPWDGDWHLVKIKLKDLVELGSYDDGTYINAQGKFDWSDVDRLEIVPEHQSLAGIEFSFDNIQITGTEFTVTLEEEEIKPDDLEEEEEETITGITTLPETSVLKAFPNPSVDHTQIKYTITQAGATRLCIHNLYGQCIKTLVNEYKVAGNYTVEWNLTDTQSKHVAAGLYIIRLNEGNGRAATEKIIIQRE